MKILVAGMGNVLRRDDGFGVETAKTLCDRDLPEGVVVLDVGTGGIHLVQALLDGYDALIVLDTVDRGAEPGAVFVLEPEVPGLESYGERERHEMLVDMHYTVPSRAMILARALNSLPGRVWIVGCQPLEIDALGIGLSRPVQAAVAEAAARVETLIAAVARELDPTPADHRATGDETPRATTDPRR